MQNESVKSNIDKSEARTRINSNSKLPSGGNLSSGTRQKTHVQPKDINASKISLATTNEIDNEPVPVISEDGKLDSVFLQNEARRLGLYLEISEPELEDVDTLGKGSSGQVNVAIDATLGRTVAVKTLHKELRMQSDQVERMIREAQAAAQLEHPNIVPIYSLGLSPTRGIYFTMKRLRGDSLRHILDELALNNPAYTWVYTFQRRLSIFIRLCQAISYAHNKGVLHRDLKPENIRIGNFGEVTIIDWGLVREVKNVNKPNTLHDIKLKADTKYQLEPFEALANSTNPTMDGDILGTPRYMSPEQAEAQNSQLDERTDIYSLGVILYELMTFYNPFYNKYAEEEIIDAVRKGIYPHPRQFENARNVPEELEAICLKAMETNKDKRYQTVSELISDVYAHQEGQTVQAYRGNPIVDTKKLFQRNPIKSSIIVSSFLAIVSFVVILYALELRNYHSIISQAEQNIKYAIKQQNVLQNRLVQIDSNLEKQKNDLLFVNLLNEIDNNFDTANLLLSSISPISQGRHKVKRLKERIFINSLRFDAHNGRLVEVQKKLDQYYSSYDIYNGYRSPELRDTISYAERILRGEAYLGNVESIPAKAELTICQILEDSDTQRLIVNDPIPISLDYGNAISNASSRIIYTPQESIRLSMGSYMLYLKSAPNKNAAIHINLARQEVMNITAVIPESIPYGTVYVPAGKAIIGNGENERVEDIPAFFIGQYEVTFAQFKEFLQSLDNPKTVKSYMPAVRFSIESNYIDVFDANWKIHDALSENCPAIGISHSAAVAYCEWYGKKMNRPCRLPTASEWEKASRGVDGRLYPWGNSFNNEYAFTIENENARRTFGNAAPPGSFLYDVSPYGAFDMAGNVREWTGSKFDDSTPFWQIKGASASTGKRFLPLFNADDMPLIPSDVGFRILMPFMDSDIAKAEESSESQPSEE